MTGLTVVTALVVLAATTGRLTWGQALAIGGATPSGAALVLGSTVVPTFYAVATAVAGLLGLTVLFARRRERPMSLPPGGIALVAFLVWSVLVTLVAPMLFDGQALVHPTSFRLVAGTLTTSNIAQIAYLVLSVCVVVFLARANDTKPTLLGIAVGLSLSLSFLRFLSVHTGLPFPEGFFDSSPTFNYIERDSDGSARFRGIQSEPAALAITCLVAIAYFLARSVQVHGARRLGCLALVAIGLWMGLISTSATFVVAGLLTSGVFLGVGVVRFSASRARMGLLAGLLVCVALVAIVVVTPSVADYVRGTVDAKVGSTSFSSRSSADSLSIQVFLDTYGFGVGLGSARASSLLPTLLSAVGVIGVLLLLVSLVTFVRSALGDRACLPTLSALVALLVVQLTSSPDLTGPSGLLWITLGVLGHSALHRRPDNHADEQELTPARA